MTSWEKEKPNLCNEAQKVYFIFKCELIDRRVTKSNIVKKNKYFRYLLMY